MCRNNLWYVDIKCQLLHFKGLLRHNDNNYDIIELCIFFSGRKIIIIQVVIKHISKNAYDKGIPVFFIKIFALYGTDCKRAKDHGFVN